MRQAFNIHWQILLFFTYAAEATFATSAAIGPGANPLTSVSYNLENCGPEDPKVAFFHKGLFFPEGNLEMRGLTNQQPLEVVGKASAVAYQADQRLQNRFFLSENGQFIGPMKKWYASPSQEDILFSQLAPQFIRGILRQMEEAIDKGYAQWVSYLDMGHIHLNLPKKVLKDDIKIDDLQDDVFQSRILGHPEVLALYHVAEKIDFYLGSKTVNSELKARFLSRNLLGKPYDPGPLEVRIATKAHQVKANTYSIPNDSDYIGAGEPIYFQGNKNGCFQLQTKDGPVNFDMSFQMPHSDPEVLVMYADQ